jgi:hypothetical protein
MSTALNFQKQEISGDYIITLKLPYSPYKQAETSDVYIQDEISAFWKKDINGVYNLSIIFSDKETNWKPYQAGLASIHRFLNETINNDLEIKIIQIDDFSEIQRKEDIKKLGSIKRKLQFYSDYLYDEDIDPKDKYLDCNNLKLYFFEKILTELCEDDIEKIGKKELLLHGVNVTLSRSQTQKLAKWKKDKEEKLHTITFNNTFDFNMDYKVDLIKINDIKVFFRSVEENNEKQIAVLYYTGFDCQSTSQRIRKLRKTDQSYLETENKKIITFCSDWEIVTNGNDRIIRDMGNRAAILLAKYLNVTEKFILNQSFIKLWEMCKTSS